MAQKKTNLTYRELGENFFNNRTIENYNALYNKVRPGLKNYIYQILKDKDATEDILANTLVKLWTKIHKFNPKYQITTWLYRIAFNESLGYLRQDHKKLSLDYISEYGFEVSESNEGDDVEGNSGNSLSTNDLMVENDKSEEDYLYEDELLQQQYQKALECIDNLGPMYKNILQDRLIDGMKYEDIAAKYDIKLQTVKNRIRRGKILISKEMKKEFEEIMV